MLYIVSGYMRSGTSMMMRALSAGGITAAFDPARDKMNETFGDNLYKPNEDGFFELSNDGYADPEIAKTHDGKLIKVLVSNHKAMINLINGGVPYRVVFMLRNPEEIRQSFDAFWGDDLQVRRVVKNYSAFMRNAVRRFKRTAESVDVMQLRKVDADPLSSFELLKSRGWPIAPVVSSSFVYPERIRHKIEELEVGI